MEIHSTSKAFNMTGGAGLDRGDALVVRAFADVKDNFDSGQFKAIQKAAMYALQHPEITLEIARNTAGVQSCYETLNAVGFAPKSRPRFLPLHTGATRYRRWAAFASGEDFCQYLIPRN